MHKWTIFATDNQSPLFLIQFRHAMESASGKQVVPLLGCWKGEREVAFLMDSKAFDTFVAPSGAVDKQECIMRVSDCNKQYADLEYADVDGYAVKHAPQSFGVNGGSTSLGSLKAVPREEALEQDGWTWRPDLATYFITVLGNPDTVPPQGGW